MLSFVRSSRSSRTVATRATAAVAAPSLFLILFVVAPAPALAYLDPGSGSMFLQVLLGGVAGAMVFLRLLWRRLRNRLRPGSAGAPPADPSSGDPPV